MVNLSAFMGTIAVGLAACLLRSGILGHLQTGGSEWVAPDNYFVGLGGLLVGMGIVLLLMFRSDSKIERNQRPVNALPPIRLS